MNNKTLLLTLSFTLGTLFTNAQSLSGFQWGEGMGTPDLSWTAQVGAKTYPEGNDRVNNNVLLFICSYF